jgi:hypothetical protein
MERENMKLIPRIKAIVTSKKWKAHPVGTLIDLPVNLQNDFLKFNYGEILHETPVVVPEDKIPDIETPEKRIVAKSGRKPKHK